MRLGQAKPIQYHHLVNIDIPKDQESTNQVLESRKQDEGDTSINTINAKQVHEAAWIRGESKEADPSTRA